MLDLYKKRRYIPESTGLSSNFARVRRYQHVIVAVLLAVVGAGMVAVGVALSRNP